MEVVIKKINELQSKYLDRKNECLMNENLSGENMYQLAIEVAERCKEFINDFSKEEKKSIGKSFQIIKKINTDFIKDIMDKIDDAKKRGAYNDLSVIAYKIVMKMIEMNKAAKDIEKSFQVLELHGIPRNRAKTVHNGIHVLVNRLSKGNNYNFQFLQDQHQKTEKLNKAKLLFENKSGSSESDLDSLSYNERLNLLIELRKVIYNEKPK